MTSNAVPATKPVARGRRGPYSKSSERRASIIEAAFEVFAAHGYQGSSFQQVADIVGMSQTSLFHYFPSKSDLLLAVLQRRDEVAAGGASELPTDGTFTERILQQARWNESRPGLISLYSVLSGEAVMEEHPGRAYVSERMSSLRERYAGEFRELAARGRLRDGVDPDRAAASILALWDGIQLQWLLTPDEIDVVAHLRDYLELVTIPAPVPARRPSNA